MVKFYMGAAASSRPATADSRPTKCCRARTTTTDEESLTDQRRDVAEMLQAEADATIPERRPQSAALQAAMRGRPTTAQVARVQLSARTRAEHERQEQNAAELAAQLAAVRQREAARLGHDRTVLALRERRAEQRATAAKLEAQTVAHSSKRAEAMEALRLSTAAARERLHKENLAAIRTREAATAKREASLAKLAAEQKELETFGAAAKQAAFEANPYFVQRQRDEACRAAREKAHAEEVQQQKMAAVKSRLASQLAREKAMREKEAKAKAAQRPLPHVNLEEPRPRTRHPDSCVELG